jgi:hypothetical protein
MVRASFPERPTELTRIEFRYITRAWGRRNRRSTIQNLPIIQDLSAAREVIFTRRLNISCIRAIGQKE